jgi:uncharacterized protein YcgL (UPF0745 family)
MKSLLELKDDFDKELAKRVWDMDLINRFCSGQTFKDNLPTLFRLTREFKKKVNSDSKLPVLIYAVFGSEATRNTKRNLRIELKNEPKEKRIFFYFGIPHTTVVYKNPVIQSFFEFSLFYSWTKKIELTAKKAKTAFIKASKVALHLPLEKEEETQVFNNFLNFIQGNTGYFDSTNLPTLKTGRKLEYQLAVTMAKDGLSFSQIAMHFAKVIKKEEIKTKVDERVKEYLREEHTQKQAENLTIEYKKELVKAIVKNVREALREQGFTVRNGKIQETKANP